MASQNFINNFAHAEQPMALNITMPSNTNIPHTTNESNTLFDDSTTNQSNTNTRLDSSNTPMASSLARQDTNSHGMPFRDPKMAGIATSLQRSLLSQGTSELNSFELEMDVGLRLVWAMKARNHHPRLACRLATLLDSFTTNPNEKTVVPTDQCLHLLGSKIHAFDSSHRKAIEENQHAQEALLKLKEEMSQLRSERDLYRNKASYFHNLEAHLRQTIDEHNRAVTEIQSLNHSNRNLKASFNKFMQRCENAAPKVLSSTEVVNRHFENQSHLSTIPTTQETTPIENSLRSSSPWPPSLKQQSDQTTQHHGHVISHQIAGPFYQGPMTPSSSTNPSPAPVGQKRGSDCFDNGTPSRETQPPVKKTKTTGQVKEKQAPKKPALKKTAVKKPEPKRKAPRRTKKDKKEEATKMWTTQIIAEQERFFGQSKDPASALEAQKVVELIEIPDDVVDEDSDMAYETFYAGIAAGEA